jgi:hypothetical protein
VETVVRLDDLHHDGTGDWTDTERSFAGWIPAEQVDESEQRVDGWRFESIGPGGATRNFEWTVTHC